MSSVAERAVPAQADLDGRSPVELGEDCRVAARVKQLTAEGRLEEAREAFAPLVATHQRRASRIAYHLLRDAAEADEAVQDAFVKVFTHIGAYRENAPFEVWFTKILVNGCLDRQKARRRRSRWLVAPFETDGPERSPMETTPVAGPSPEDSLLGREQRHRIRSAVSRLPNRQRTVVTLCLYDERSPQEVSELTGMNHSTVRVHLFRAIRKLRALLEDDRDARR